MGSSASTEEVPDNFFDDLLAQDIKINDQICKQILTSRPLTHKSLENPILSTIIRKKPNNVRVLLYQSVFSISRISQIQYQTEIPQAILVSCYNAYLVLQRFCQCCVSKWHTWPSPSNQKGTLPTILFQSSATLIGHPQIQRALDNSMHGFIRLEIFATMLKYLLAPNQEQYEDYPNHHFYALDITDPMPIFEFVFSKRRMSQELQRICSIICATGLGFCVTWAEAVADVPFLSILQIFDTLLQTPNDNQLSLAITQNPGTFHELFALFYMILVMQPNAVETLPNGRSYIVAILLPLQLFNEKNSLSYFHSLALSSLVLLTADPILCASLNEPYTATFPSKSSVHRGTYADLLVEIITNTVGGDLTQTAPLLPAVACILHNISAHVNSFSFFTSNRIFRFLNLLIESRDRQAPKLVQIVIDAIDQIIYEQFERNTTILMFVVRNQKTFKMLKTRGIEVKYVLAFIAAFKSKVKTLGIAKLGTDEAERIFRELNPKSFMSDYEPPGPRGHVFTGEMAELWPDWMRTIAMRGGGFKCFQTH